MFNSPPFTLLFSLFLSSWIISCAPQPKEAEDKDVKKPKPELVGRIASIPSSREFVLIQAYGKWIVETGTILTTVGPEGRAANLRVTGEKLGQFAAADIQSGTLEVGDGVYTLPKLSLTQPTPASASEKPVTKEPSTPLEEAPVTDLPSP
ncbi:MAG: hypothetical protein AB8D78_01205 [Akkermansiaceae bacterium]